MIKKKYSLYSLLIESVEEKNKTDDEMEEDLKSLLKKEYPQFVKELDDLLNDEDFAYFLRGDLSDKNKLTIKKETVKCNQLFPLQDEIGIKESIDYVILNKLHPEQVKKMLTNQVLDSSDYDSQSRYIITCNKKYIVDGHHRWSSVYALNPNAEIIVKDIGNFKDEVDALKLSQLIIGALKGFIPKSSARGLNLFNCDLTQLMKHIRDNIADDFVAIYKKTKPYEDKSDVIRKIYKNMLALREKNKPGPRIVDVNKRDIMPQFDNSQTYLDRAGRGEVRVSAIKTENRKRYSLLESLGFEDIHVNMSKQMDQGRNFDYGNVKSDSQEGRMAKQTLKTIIKNAQELERFLNNADDLPEWCHSYLAVIEDRLKTVNEYLQSKESK
jgi:hypothetical protein